MQNLRSQTDAPKETFFQTEFNSIESRLKTLSELDGRIGSAIGRLVNPRPTSAAQPDGSPIQSPSTVEGQLQYIVRTLDNIIGGLRDHAETLDSAI